MANDPKKLHITKEVTDFYKSIQQSKTPGKWMVFSYDIEKANVVMNKSVEDKNAEFDQKADEGHWDDFTTTLKSTGHSWGIIDFYRKVWFIHYPPEVLDDSCTAPWKNSNIKKMRIQTAMASHQAKVKDTFGGGIHLKIEAHDDDGLDVNNLKK